MMSGVERNGFCVEVCKDMDLVLECYVKLEWGWLFCRLVFVINEGEYDFFECGVIF